MVELFLVALVAAVMVERHFAQRGWESERRFLINRIVAESPAEVVALDRSPTMPPRRRPSDTEAAEAEARIHPIGL